MRTAEPTQVFCTEDALVEQSQVCEGLFDITLLYRSFVSNRAHHVCEIKCGRSSRDAATRRKMLSPAGHIREYLCVLAMRRDNAPEVGHKRMSECHACCRGGAACPDRMLEHLTIPL